MNEDAAGGAEGTRAEGTTRIHDVAIVGAGSVGLLLACLLARRMTDVVVVERVAHRPAGGS